MLKRYLSVGAGAAVMLGIYLGSLHNYLLVHSVVEIATIAIALALFMLVWNTRAYSDNSCLRLLGIGYAFSALIDLVHALAYKGMNVFPGYDANLPTQLWLAARYLQTATLVAAPLVLGRRLNERAVVAAYAAAVTVLGAAAFSGYFPDCYVEGKGLTNFKIGSEYLLSALLLGTLYLFVLKREHFDDKIFGLVAASIVCTALSEISFTAYVSVYGFSNLVGHGFKLAAFLFIYRAIFVTGIKAPFDLIFRELKQAELGLRQAQDTLEDQVRARTAELRASEERYSSLIRKLPAAIVVHDGQGRLLYSNPVAQDILGLPSDQLLGKTLGDPDWHFVREDGSTLPVAEYPAALVLSSCAPLRDYITGIKRADREEITWVLVNAGPEIGESGEIERVIVTFFDISRRKRAEAELAQQERRTQSLLRLSRNMEKSRSYAQVLEAARDEVRNILGYQSLWAYLLTEDRKYARALVAGGPATDVIRSDPDISTLAVEGDRMMEEIAAAREIVVVADARTDPRTNKEIVARTGNRTIVNVPIILFDRHMGSVGTGTFGEEGVRVPSETEQEYLMALASHMAVTLDRIHLSGQRKQVEEALRASEGKLRAIFETLHELIWLKDPDGVFLACNPMFERLFDKREAEIVGKTDYDFIERNLADFFRTNDRRAMDAGEPTVNEEWLTFADDGHRALFETVKTPMFDADGKLIGVLGIARDITARKQAEEALQRLNRELRAMSNCNQILVRAVDEQTLLQDICRTVCDDAGYRFAWVGYAEQDKTVRPVAWAGAEEGYLASSKIGWADDGKYGSGPAGRAIRSGKAVYIQDFETDPDTAHWRARALQRGYRSAIALPLKDESGSIFGALLIYSEKANAITPEEIRLLEELAGDLAFGITVLRARDRRKQAERELALVNFAMNRVREAAFLIDQDARFQYVNDDACQVLEYSREELLGLSVADVDPDFPPERWQEHWHALQERKGSYRFEGRHRTKSGRIFPVEIAANYFEYEGRGYNLALARDITERKRVEDALVFIAQRGWQTGADDFFDTLAQFLCEKLDMDYAVIDRMDENPEMAETVALYAKGAVRPSLRYALKGTPCENVLGRRLCVYRQGVQQLFPEDALLVEMGAESYVGIPLWDSSGRPIGLIAVMGNKPLIDAAPVTQLLQLVATRAAAELERGRSDRLLRTSEHNFRTLAENLPDNIVRYDREGRTIYVNPVLERTLGFDAACMLGTRIRELYPDGSYELYAQAVDAALASGENGEIELTVPVPSKEPIVHQIRMIAERDEFGEVIGVLAIGRDITERKRAELRLRASEQAFRAVVENTPDVIVRYDREGRRIFVNPAFERINHISANEVLGKKPLELSTELAPRADEFTQRLMSAMDAGTITAFDLCYTVDGKPKWWYVRVVPEFDAVGKVASALTIFSDVTEPKLAEAQLKLAASVFEHAHEGVTITDAGANIIAVNRRFTEVTGYSAEEVIGRNPRMLKSGRHDAAFYRAMWASIDADGFWAGEIWNRRKDGSAYPEWLSISCVRDDGGKVANYVAVFADVSERVAAEAALRESERHLRFALGAARMLAWERDLRNDTTTWGEHPDWAFGPEPAGGYPDVVEMVHPDDREVFLAAGNDAIERGTPYSVEFRLMRTDGEVIWVRLQGMPFSRDGTQRPDCMIGVSQDITERRRIEDELRRFNEDLESKVEERTRALEIANRELEAFSYSVSHDLRSPLRAVLGYSRALQEDYAGRLDANAREYLRRIDAGAGKMAQLIEDLLMLSRVSRQEVRMELVDLSALAREVVAEMQAHESSGRTGWSIAPALEAKCDRGLLQVVLYNLLDNARKYSSKRQDARVEFGRVEEDGRMVYFVRDNGAGFDMAYASKLFGAYQRLHSADEFPGTGIGLATVARIIQRHGGEIWAEGRPGAGASFYFTL